MNTFLNYFLKNKKCSMISIFKYLLRVFAFRLTEKYFFSLLFFLVRKFLFTFFHVLQRSPAFLQLLCAKLNNKL